MPVGQEGVLDNMVKNNEVTRKTSDLLIEQARHMRKNPTQAEASLWEKL